MCTHPLKLGTKHRAHKWIVFAFDGRYDLIIMLVKLNTGHIPKVGQLLILSKCIQLKAHTIVVICIFKEFKVQRLLFHRPKDIALSVS